MHIRGPIVVVLLALALIATNLNPPSSAEAASTGAGIVVVGGPAVVSDEAVGHLDSCTPDGATRVAGADRYATAAAIAAQWTTADTVFIATGLDFPDALGGGPVAALNDAPILLTRKDSIPAVTNSALNRLSPSRIVILGGPEVIAPAVMTNLQSRFKNVVRLGGEDRYATAAAVSAWHFTTGSSRVYIATGTSFPDALVAGPQAASQGAPLLLVGRDELPDATASELRRLAPREIVIVGSSGAVSGEVEAALASYTSGTVTRLAGTSRYSTAAAVAATASGRRVLVVTGDDYADGLAATAASNGAPILFVTASTLNPTTAAAIGARTGTNCASWNSPNQRTGIDRSLDWPTKGLACSRTVSSGVDLGALIGSVGDGSVICLADGEYGTLTVDAQRRDFVTVRAVNPLGAVFDRIVVVDASHVRFEQLKVRGQIGTNRDNGSDSSNNIHVIGNDVTGVVVAATSRDSAGPGPSDWVIEYNDIHDCTGFCVGLLSADPDRYWPVSNVVVRGNKMGPMNGGQDAIRISNWRNIVIEDNEIFGVIEDGQHNDCLQSVWGGRDLVFSGNYLHDNNCQTFFLKDGYTEDIVFEENLSLRNRAGDASVGGKIYPSRNVVMRNNTLWDDSAFYLRSGSYDSRFAQGPIEDYEITNNVILGFLPYDDNQSNSNKAGVFKDPNILAEDYNVFGGGWTWVPGNMGSHSVEDADPNFVNKTATPAQDLATGDWRLRGAITSGGQTYTAGITWRLAGRLFGTDAYNNG